MPPAGTRPTSDRVRESMFSSLDSELGTWVGLRVIDLYAGSGALGLEARSRGADHVLLVESDRRAVDVCRANVAAVGLDAVSVLTADVERLVAVAPPVQARPPYDLVLADPPYDLAAARLAEVLAALVDGGWVAPGAVVVVERSAREDPFPWPAGIEALRHRRYGETALWYGRHQSTG